ncbi:MAG: hypothetical protein INF91_00045 [Alphaproteobacteria bacterium]|nr:hypothetical protein [Alphaproteobacteria bacterium]
MARLRTQTAWGDAFPELTESRSRARRRRVATQAAMVMLALIVAAAVMAVIQLLASAQQWLTELVGPHLPGLSRTADAALHLVAFLRG